MPVEHWSVFPLLGHLPGITEEFMAVLGSGFPVAVVFCSLLITPVPLQFKLRTGLMSGGFSLATGAYVLCNLSTYGVVGSATIGGGLGPPAFGSECVKDAGTHSGVLGGKGKGQLTIRLVLMVFMSLIGFWPGMVSFTTPVCRDAAVRCGPVQRPISPNPKPEPGPVQALKPNPKPEPGLVQALKPNPKPLWGLVWFGSSSGYFPSPDLDRT
ncbi:hypothetical protein V8E53_011840 [Lactarius tabidus]